MCPNSDAPKVPAGHGGSFEFRQGAAERGDRQVTVERPVAAAQTVCPRCGKPSWAPYVMKVVGKYGRVYEYLVFRHPDGRRRTPKKCTWKVQ